MADMSNAEYAQAKQARGDAYRQFLESPKVADIEERLMHINDSHVTGEDARSVGEAEIAEVWARHSTAQANFEEERKRIDPDGTMAASEVQSQMRADTVQALKESRIEMDATMDAFNREQAQRKLNAEAKALRESAVSDADYQRERVQAAMQHRLIADHVIFTMGGVLESRIPIWRPADSLRIRLEQAEPNTDGTRGKANAVSVQPVIYAPEIFRGRNDLFNASAMCRDIEAGLVRRALRAAGGQYADVAERVMTTGDTGAWVSKLFWPSWVDLLANWGPFTDDMVVTMVDLDDTDKIPLPVVSSWPDMAFIAEGGNLSFSNMGTKVPELDAHLIAGGTEVTDKQIRNSWFRGLGALDIIQAKHGAQIGYKANSDISVGSGGANEITGLLNKTNSSGSGQIKAGNSHNVIADAVTASQPTGGELIDLMHEVNPAYRNVSSMTGAAFMGNSKTVAAIRRHETPNRFINEEGQSLITGSTEAITARTPDDSAHVAYRLSGIPFIENTHLFDLEAGKDGALAFGAWKCVHVRRSSHYSAMEQPGTGSLFGDKVDARLASWQYFEALPAQVDGITATSPGPIVLADAK